VANELRALLKGRIRYDRIDEGAILGVLQANHIKAVGTDISSGDDFLARTTLPPGDRECAPQALLLAA